MHGYGDKTMMIKMYDGIVRTLPEIRHVLELQKKLISFGSLDVIGYCYKAGDVVIQVTKGSLIVMNDVKKNSLYVFKVIC